MAANFEYADGTADENIPGTRAWRAKQAAVKRRRQWITIALCTLLGIAGVTAGAICFALRAGVEPSIGRSAADTCVLPNDRQQRVLPGDDPRCNPLYTTYTDAGAPLLVVGGIIILVSGGVAWSKRRDELRSAQRAF